MKPNYLASSENQDIILNICMDMALSLGPKVFINQSRALQGRSDQQNNLTVLDMPVLDNVWLRRQIMFHREA